MSDRFFLDTNILVYSFDHSQPAKRDRARSLVALGLEGNGVISFLVIQEFLNVALRKFSQPMTHETAQRYLDEVLVPLCRIHSEPDLYRDALAVQLRWRVSWYDSLIVAGARRAGCARLLSEDFQHGQDLGGLVVSNPFREQ